MRRVFKAAHLPWVNKKSARTDLVAYEYAEKCKGLRALRFALASSGFSEWEVLGYTDSYHHAQAQAQRHFEDVLNGSGLVKELR